jgi:putative CocE/NonD family hydrolase
VTKTWCWTLSALLVAAAPSFGQAEAPYEAVLFEADFKMPMRDGVRLASDIYRPATDGEPVAEPLPVLLQRTPYDKTGDSIVAAAEFFARHGYVVVLQDLRGRYRSEGVFTKYTGEGKDGYDAIEFVAGLDFTNGKVGMWGTSYGAHVQANAAKLDPPHLETMVLNMGGMSNGWDHKVRNHGAFELQQVTWAFNQLAIETDDPLIRTMLEQEAVADWLTRLPLRKGLNPLSAAPNFEDYILTMQNHGDYDDYWKDLDVNWVEYYDQTADVPMLLLSGWYDSYGGGTIDNYLGLLEHLESPLHLIMGPWTHSGNTRSHAGNVEFGPDASIEDFHHEFHLRWFDRHLRGESIDLNASPVMVFVMGSGDGHKDDNGRLYHGGYWKEGPTWPLPGTEFRQYFLHADGGLRTDRPGARSAATTYTFDPDDPVPTIGGSFSSTSPTFESGAYDQREYAAVFGAKLPYLPLKARHDVLVFQTEPLAEDVALIGPIVVKLFVSSTAVDTDFTAKLVDVYPPSSDFPSGYEMNITDGILRMRYRNRPDQPELMRPDQSYEITVTPFPTANIFKKGHRIRIDISSSNFPRFDINPNTGEALGKNRRVVAADNTIYHDASRPSHVILPIAIH